MKRTGAAERWRELLRRQATSGLSVTEFCRRQDVSEASFYQWRKRLRAESPPEAAPADFLVDHDQTETSRVADRFVHVFTV